MVAKDSTRDLVRLAQAGDRDAFQELAKRFQTRLENQIQSRMGAMPRAIVEVEDILQETFTGALESITKLKWQGEESFYRWLASIAEHLIWASARRTAKSPLRLEHEAPAKDPSPSKNVRRDERFDRLQNALNKLSDAHRTVIVLARLERLNMEEIARRMGRSPNAVKKLLARALLEMKQSFGDTESLHLPDRFFEASEVDNDE